MTCIINGYIHLVVWRLGERVRDKHCTHKCTLYTQMVVLFRPVTSRLWLRFLSRILVVVDPLTENTPDTTSQLIQWQMGKYWFQWGLLFSCHSQVALRGKELQGGTQRNCISQTGTMLSIMSKCSSCDGTYIWKSQPYLLGKFPAGNILLSSLLFVLVQPWVKYSWF